MTLPTLSHTASAEGSTSYRIRSCIVAVASSGAGAPAATTDWVAGGARCEHAAHSSDSASSRSVRVFNRLRLCIPPRGFESDQGRRKASQKLCGVSGRSFGCPSGKNADRCDLLRLLVMASTHDSIFVQIIFQSRRIERGAGHSNVAYLTMRDRRTPFFQGPHRFAGAVKIP